MLVIVSLPLVNIYHKYYIYKIHNLSFAINGKDDNMPTALKSMVAYRRIESKCIGVNMERSHFMLLDK